MEEGALGHVEAEEAEVDDGEEDEGAEGQSLGDEDGDADERLPPSGLRGGRLRGCWSDR